MNSYNIRHPHKELNAVLVVLCKLFRNGSNEPLDIYAWRIWNNRYMYLDNLDEGRNDKV